MKLEDYSSNAICRAMSLPNGFVEDSWLQSEFPTMRLLLKPSFHPEVCATLIQKSIGTELSVRALSEQLWAQQNPRLVIPYYDEECIREAGLMTELIEIFDRALREIETEPESSCYDGMSVGVCLVSAGVVRRLKANACLVVNLSALVERIIEVAFTKFKDPRLRSALTPCAPYCWGAYLMPKSPAKIFTNLAVLGTEKERADYFNKLKAARQAAKGQG